MPRARAVVVVGALGFGALGFRTLGFRGLVLTSNNNLVGAYFGIGRIKFIIFIISDYCLLLILIFH